MPSSLSSYQLSTQVLTALRQDLLVTAGAAADIRSFFVRSVSLGTRGVHSSSIPAATRWSTAVPSSSATIPLASSRSRLLGNAPDGTRGFAATSYSRHMAGVGGYGSVSPAVRPLLCSSSAAIWTANTVSRSSCPAARHYSIPSGFDFKASVTNIILVINFAAFALQNLTHQKFTSRFMKSNSDIRRGEYWRLLTPAFLHADVMHLLVNSYSLYNLGNFLEPWSGDGRFLTIYLASAVAGNIASFYYNRYPAVGASTSIFGLIGAELVFWARHKDIFPNAPHQIQQLLMITAFNLIFGFMNKGIDNSGHIGGFLGGALVAWLLGPAFVRAWGGYEDKPPVGAMAWKDRRL